MEPTADSEDVIVDLLDVLLEKGVVLEADVVIGVADIPLVGIKLRAAIAGLTTMREYGMFEEWDLQQRRQRRSHQPMPGGSMTGRPNPRRPRDPETEPTVASGRPAESSRPDGSARPRHRDRPAETRRPAGQSEDAPVSETDGEARAETPEEE
ncbi:gas vesicle protein GvpM [Halohasta salina]|uniref:gas vesicle protein GvpM n=1 Tax=Halohasta salina TaxID=2961621 RepID=UPI003CCCA4BA